MCKQLELPFMDQTPYTPYYFMWQELFKQDNRLKYLTPKIAMSLFIKADFHEDEIASFLKENTGECKNCHGEGYFDPVACHGFGLRKRTQWPCGGCHCTGTIFINIPKHG